MNIIVFCLVMTFYTLLVPIISKIMLVLTVAEVKVEIPTYVKPLPHPKTKYGTRIFTNPFSRFWNDLSDYIKMESIKPLFKTRLKNYILEKQSNA